MLAAVEWGGAGLGTHVRARGQIGIAGRARPGGLTATDLIRRTIELMGAWYLRNRLRFAKDSSACCRQS